MEVQEQPAPRRWWSMGTYWKKLGPGLTTGAADDDPSGIATYSQTGAQTGLRFLWLSPLTLPLMVVVQEMCARIGLVTGRGLAANIRLRYPVWVLITSTTLLFLANTFNLGVNLGAMAEASRLIFPSVPGIIFVILFTLISLGLQILIPYRTYARYLKYLALILFAYVISALLAGLDWQSVTLHAITPSLPISGNEWLLVTAILGTTISPYLFFWQTSQEVEEEIMQGKKTVKERQKVSSKDIRDMRIDVWSGMFVSNLVMFFIIASSAAVFSTHGIATINSAAEAAEALAPLAGASASLLFTIGIIGTGLLSIPILAGSASYAIAESLRWKEGLYRRFKDAYAFYGVLIIAMLLGLVINLVNLDPIKALVYAAVANGVVAPIVLFFIVRLSGSKKIMGSHANGPVRTVLGWGVTALMTIAAVGAIASLVI